MPLTDTQRAEIIETIRKKCDGYITCSCCGRPDWGLIDGIAQLPVSMNIRQYQLGGPNMPIVALVCKHCSHTIFFNILALGIENLFKDAIPGKEE